VAGVLDEGKLSSTAVKDAALLFDREGDQEKQYMTGFAASFEMIKIIMEGLSGEELFNALAEMDNQIEREFM